MMSPGGGVGVVPQQQPQIAQQPQYTMPMQQQPQQQPQYADMNNMNNMNGGAMPAAPAPLAPQQPPLQQPQGGAVPPAAAPADPASTTSVPPATAAPAPPQLGLYKAGENLPDLPGFLSQILMDEVRVHSNRSVVTVAS